MCKQSSRLLLTGIHMLCCVLTGDVKNVSFVFIGLLWFSVNIDISLNIINKFIFVMVYSCVLLVVWPELLNIFSSEVRSQEVTTLCILIPCATRSERHVTPPYNISCQALSLSAIECTQSFDKAGSLHTCVRWVAYWSRRVAWCFVETLITPHYWHRLFVGSWLPGSGARRFNTANTKPLICTSHLPVDCSETHLNINISSTSRSSNSPFWNRFLSSKFCVHSFSPTLVTHFCKW